MKDIQCEMMITLHPTLACTFSCVYCERHTTAPAKAIDIEKTMVSLEKFQKTFLVIISGGEPFLVPNFIEFVAELTKKHYARIDTNLSLTAPCRKFIDRIDPGRIQEISFSTHVLEREQRGQNLMGLVTLVREFQKKGFQMVGNYVAYPPLLGRLEKDLGFFSAQGITVLPTFFEGTFQGTRFPLDHGRLSYSEDQLKLIKRFNVNATLPLSNPRNELCQAGSSAFWVNNRLEVFPCLGIQDNKLGDFADSWTVFPKVIRCPINYCSDHYHRTFNCTLDTQSLGRILQKTLSEKKACSGFESFMLLRKHWMRRPFAKIKEIAVFLLRRITLLRQSPLL